MAIEIEATHENGVLEPRQPLPLDEHEVVTVRITAKRNRMLRAAGSMKWIGDPEILRCIAEDPNPGELESE